MWDEYLLPAATLRDGTSVPSVLGTLQHDAFSSRRALLDVRVELDGADAAFKRCWTLVLRAAGARVSDRRLVSGERLHAVVVQDAPTALLESENQRRAEARVPVLGTNWIVGSLARGEALPCDEALYGWQQQLALPPPTAAAAPTGGAHRRSRAALDTSDVRDVSTADTQTSALARRRRVIA
jgi:hypothetical protein